MANGNELNRRDLEAAIELRPPALEKVFDREIFGRRLKHVIEPIFTYRYTTGVDNFQNVIRFDQTDISATPAKLNTTSSSASMAAAAPAVTNPAARLPAPPLAGRTEKSTSYIPGVSAVRPRCEDESKTTREMLSLGGEAEVLHG